MHTDFFGSDNLFFLLLTEKYQQNFLTKEKFENFTVLELLGFFCLMLGVDKFTYLNLDIYVRKLSFQLPCNSNLIFSCSFEKFVELCYLIDKDIACQEKNRLFLSLFFFCPELNTYLLKSEKRIKKSFLKRRQKYFGKYFAELEKINIKTEIVLNSFKSR